MRPKTWVALLAAAILIGFAFLTWCSPPTEERKGKPTPLPKEGRTYYLDKDGNLSPAPTP